MAGPGIRYWNLARIVATQQPVTLAVPEMPPMDPPPGVRIVAYGSGDRDAQGQEISNLAAKHDVLVSQMPPYLYMDQEILRSRKMVIDLYAPWFLEKLEYARVDPERGEPLRADDLDILRRLLNIGDFYICASERQRDFWLGSLAAAGRLRTRQLDADPELRSLIDVVPMGLTAMRPIPNGPGPREKYPFIGPDDPILLWNGGIWNWLDPATAIHATYQLVEEGMSPRLIFMGVKSPSQDTAEMELVDAAQRLASNLGIAGKYVMFNDWVEYDHRQNWLLQSAMTISLHQPTIESRFAFRTRILDNLWCRVPAIATEGDVLADLVAGHGLGKVVPPAQPRAVAEAILGIMRADGGGDIRRRIGTVAQGFTWEQVTEPLLRYCGSPWTNRSDGDGGDYVHKLERLYAETAKYAKSLETAIEEKNHALDAAKRHHSQQSDPWRERIQIWKRRA